MVNKGVKSDEEGDSHPSLLSGELSEFLEREGGERRRKSRRSSGEGVQEGEGRERETRHLLDRFRKFSEAVLMEVLM